MIFSRNWLANYVELPTSIDELAARLTAAGHAVEAIEDHGDDVLLDLDITTNRTDCMNHFGVAREIAALLDRSLEVPPTDLEESDEPASGAASVEIESFDDCPRYVARVVRGVKVGPSPAWLVERLEAIGLRPINNVVDVSNFVLWELGQPLHAFDLHRLEGATVAVRRGAAGEKLTTLDGEERELGPEILVIADAARPVALAGIMGGLDSEVTEATTDILIESAHFERRLVRRGAGAFGMHTDASHRFERGADPAACAVAAARAARLIAEIAGGTVLAGAIDARRQEDFWHLEGDLELARLEAFAGIRFSAADVQRWLTGLGFELEGSGSPGWRVTVPAWRYYDFLEPRETGEVFEADLFEEAMRIHGFDAIPATLPALGEPDAGSSRGHELRHRVGLTASAAGLVETINFAFVDRQADARFAGLEAAGEPVELENPLSERYAVMRRSLLPGLLETAAFNQRRGSGAVRIFEIGNVFPGVEVPEFEMIGILMGGTLGHPWDRTEPCDLFDLKGVVEALLAPAGHRLEVASREVDGMVNGTACDLLVDGEVVGQMGQIDSTESYPLFGAELRTSVLERSERGVAIEIPSRFPGVAADFTLTHDVSVSWSEIAAEIESLQLPNLVSFGLKDRFEGDQVGPGRVNTTVHFLYNAEERSLTQEEINEQQGRVAEALTRSFSSREDG